MPLPVLHCPVCGLVLERRFEGAICSYCGAVDGDHRSDPSAPWRCASGHHLCEDCRTAMAEDLPRRIVPFLGQTDPFAIADLVMSHPAMRQETYGPDHHGLPALALLVGLRNAGLWEGSDSRILAAVRRAREIGEGSCYLRGTCGACVGAGSALSTVLHLGIASPERGLALRATALSLGSLARTGGLRCCKEAVYAALEGAIEALVPVLPAIATMKRPVVCGFSSSLPDCKGMICPYHPRSAIADTKEAIHEGSTPP